MYYCIRSCETWFYIRIIIQLYLRYEVSRLLKTPCMVSRHVNTTAVRIDVVRLRTTTSCLLSKRRNPGYGGWELGAWAEPTGIKDSRTCRWGNWVFTWWIVWWRIKWLNNFTMPLNQSSVRFRLRASNQGIWWSQEGVHVSFPCMDPRNYFKIKDKKLNNSL